MDYQTYLPNQTLAPFVKCYWTLECSIANKPKIQTIVPDGCIEMIFHLGDCYKQYFWDGRSMIQPKSFVYGQLTHSIQIEPTGSTKIFAVRFHPDGFSPFSDKALNTFEDRAISLEEVFGNVASKINQTIRATESTSHRIAHLEVFLTAKLEKKQAVDQVVKSTIRTILSEKGQVSIKELSQQTDLSRRQLERKFAKAIGLSPKKLATIIRFQAALKRLLSQNYISLTDLAYENEFYDQSHFTKTFKQITGYTPKQFFHNNFQMKSLFTEETSSKYFSTTVIN